MCEGQQAEACGMPGFPGYWAVMDTPNSADTLTIGAVREPWELSLVPRSDVKPDRHASKNTQLAIRVEATKNDRKINATVSNVLGLRV